MRIPLIGFCDSWWLLGSTGISWVPWAGVLWSATMGTRKPGGGKTTAKITQTLADFLQLQYKTSENYGNNQLSIKQEGKPQSFTLRVALGVRGSSAHLKVG